MASEATTEDSSSAVIGGAQLAEPPSAAEAAAKETLGGGWNPFGWLFASTSPEKEGAAESGAAASASTSGVVPKPPPVLRVEKVNKPPKSKSASADKGATVPGLFSGPFGALETPPPARTKPRQASNDASTARSTATASPSGRICIERRPVREASRVITFTVCTLDRCSVQSPRL